MTNNSSKSLLLASLLLFGLAFPFLSLPETSAFSTGRDLLEKVENASRYDPFTGEAMSNRFCGIESDGTTHCVSYLKWLAVIGGFPGVLMTLVCLAFFLSYLIFHIIAYCCCNLGKTKFCLASPFKRGKVWWLVQIVIWICTALALLFFVAAIVVDWDIRESVNRVENTITNTSSTVHGVMDTILTDLRVTGMTDQIEGELRNKFTEVTKKIESVEKDVDHYNSIRTAVFLSVFGLPFLLGLILSIFGIFRIRWATVTFGLLLVFASILLWAILSAHLAVSIALDDVCPEVLDLAQSKVGKTSPITLVISCANGTSPFVPVVDILHNISSTFVESACNETKKLCSQPFVDCPKTKCSSATLPEYKYANITEFICPNGTNTNCNKTTNTLQDCPEKCSNKDLKEQSKDIILGLGIVSVVDHVIHKDVLPLLDCRIIQNAFHHLNESLCLNLRRDSKIAVQISIMDAIVLVPLTLAALVGYLAYRKHEDQLSSELINEHFPLLQNTL
eukprot:TRINITY_DN10499_c0_g1_i1.p1 TRINITY_DN10499_c0_g1~~TRINITY_DN10499_c0_g1_i1.p1  ORF type:complete len:505 (+),score=84.54 TRINITY_DN10499_c0_g1_i1:131-1645(+)